MTRRKSIGWMRPMVLALALALCAASATLTPVTAQAGELSGTAVVAYTPQSWPFVVSSSGMGQVETVAESGVVVRNGSAELEVVSGQALEFRLVPDQGATVSSVRLAGEDASDLVREDNTLAVSADEARGGLDVVFRATASASDAGSDIPAIGLKALARTGDLLWVSIAALIGVMCAAQLVARSARRRACIVVRPDPDKASSHERA